MGNKFYIVFKILSSINNSCKDIILYRSFQFNIFTVFSTKTERTDGKKDEWLEEKQLDGRIAA